ncbi:MAG: hypothetical protein L0922_04975, partial [Candidatus Mariimomonas ferrooxydans]
MLLDKRFFIQDGLYFLENYFFTGWFRFPKTNYNTDFFFFFKLFSTLPQPSLTPHTPHYLNHHS